MSHARTARILVAGIIIAASTAAQAQYQSMSCGELWAERNSIFKANGYCFKTSRAISIFGNAGCRYDSEARVPLSRSERSQVNAIIAAERARGCN